MPKAEPNRSKPGGRPRPLPLGENLQPTIERLKEIAALAGNTLYLAEGPPQPDGALLDLSSEILSLAWRQNELYSQGAAMCAARVRDVVSYGDLLRRERDLELGIRRSLVRAGKLRASTPAGIYAKALMVAASRTGAAFLAGSLAADLIACHALRECLWPVDTATGEASRVAE